MREDRKKIWVDNFQTRLFWRILAYLGIYFFVLGNLLFIWRLLAEGAGDPLAQYISSFVDYAPALLCLSALMPILALDAIRFSHRLVGPLVRFRRAMQDLAEGQATRPIKLRDGDFLTDLRDDFNQMLEALQKQGLSVLKPADPADQDSRQRQSA
jgi:methyl-accepting chemotaxis protein